MNRRHSDTSGGIPVSNVGRQQWRMAVSV